MLQNLPKLVFFDARCNRIEVFPEGVLQCNDLIEVNLSRNKVRFTFCKRFILILLILCLKFHIPLCNYIDPDKESL